MEEKDILETQEPREEENQEFDLEAIMKEFGDEAEEVKEKTPDEILSEVEREVRREQGIEEAPAATEEAPEEAPESEAEPTRDLSGDTVRFEAVADVKGVVRAAEHIDDEDTPPEPEPEEEKTEPYSEEWEPEYEQPMGEYVPQHVIPFQPRSRRRELKKKLVEGPERMYYALSEQGLGKLQLAILASVILVLISAVATAMYAFGAVPENRMRLMVFWQFFAMLVAALLGSFQLIEGLADLAHKKFSLNTMLVFTFLLCLVDGIVCLSQVRIPCCAAFCLQVAMSLWCSYEKRNTKLGMLDTMRKAVRLDGVTAVDEAYEGQPALCRGEGQVEDFMDTLDQPCGMEKTVNIYALVAACISVAAGVAAGILHGDVATGIQVAAVTTLAAIPASFFVTLSRPMAVLERRYHALGVVLCGWEGVEALSRKAVFPLSHEDLFPAGTIKLNGVKFFSKRATDEIVAYATALICVQDGGLKPVFTQLLESRNGVHYDATDFTPYEEGGIGGTVNGEAVLAGSIGFLKAMGVETPEGIRVNQAVCVAIGGELCGIFAITYEKDRGAQAGLTTLCGYRGLYPMITSGSYMLSEGFLKDRFHVKTKRVIFPEYEQRAQLKELGAEPDTRAHALYTAEGLAPAAYAVTGARSLRSACKAGVIVHMIGGILGIAMMLVLAYLGATELLTPANLFLYELVLMIPGLLITQWTRSI